jgi:DNA-binding helix-hairpin-helix protein with protein kinase domain
VNHGNVLVGPTGVVRLIDCDSLQIRDRDRMFRCRVGVPTHTPPELQGVSLGSIDRTPNHDGFGLAVLIYQLLLMGRHPFAGRHEAAGEMTEERAIREHRYVFGPDAARLGTRPPPLCPPIAFLPGVIREAFDSAFGPSGKRQRPDARQWLAAIEGLTSSLTTCGTNRAHEYPAGASSCPWCELEGRAGIVLFQWIRAATAGNTFDPDLLLARLDELLGAPLSAVTELEKAWNQALYRAVPGPPALSAAVDPPPQPSAGLAAIQARVRGGLESARLLAWTVTGVVGVLCLVAGLTTGAAPVFVLPALILLVLLATFIEGQIVEGLVQPERASLQLALTLETEAAQRFAAAQQTWSKPPAIIEVERLSATLGKVYSDAEDSVRYFKRVAGELRERSAKEAHQLRDRWRGLPGERAARVRAMADQAERLAQSRFLSRFALENAGLPGIGPTRLQTLRFHGITTAADVDAAALDGIFGIGPTLTATLLSWKSWVARGYVRDPRAVVPAALQAQVDAAIRSEQDAVERALTTLVDSARLQRAEIDKRVAEKLSRVTAEVSAGTVRAAQLGAQAVEFWRTNLPNLSRAQMEAAQAAVDARVARELLMPRPGV